MLAVSGMGALTGLDRPWRFLGPYLGNCVFDYFLVRHIALVSHQKLVDSLCGVSVNLLQPLLDVVERIHIGDIVDDTDAVGTTVV
jgi:hypothetical protein